MGMQSSAHNAVAALDSDLFIPAARLTRSCLTRSKKACTILVVGYFEAENWPHSGMGTQSGGRLHCPPGRHDAVVFLEVHSLVFGVSHLVKGSGRMHFEDLRELHIRLLDWLDNIENPVLRHFTSHGAGGTFSNLRGCVVRTANICTVSQDMVVHIACHRAFLELHASLTQDENTCVVCLEHSLSGLSVVLQWSWWLLLAVCVKT
jgi:hypothetical protein